MLTLSGNIHIALTADKLYDDLACAMLGAAEQAVEEKRAWSDPEVEGVAEQQRLG